MAQEAYKGDVLQRIAGVAFILGAIATIVFNVLAPRVDDRSDIPTVMVKLAAHPTMSKLTFLGLAVGIWLTVMGIVGVYRSIATGAGSVWARLGFYGVLMSSGLLTAAFALLIAATSLAAKGAGLLLALTAVSTASNFIFAMGATTYWLALAFVGLGMALSTVYPKWLGWALLILGIATVAAAGVPQVLGNFSKTVDYSFAVLAGLTSIWALVMGVWITRREMKAM